MYAGYLDVTDPFVSALNGNFEGLATMLIFTRTHDLYHFDIVTLANKTARAGVRIEMHLRNGLQHNYPLLPTPEGREAQTIIARSVAEFALDLTAKLPLRVPANGLNAVELRL
jgi:epsilon-lactone hydrolase